jgi:4-hydroxyphenylpyruvate dioxygenase
MNSNNDIVKFVFVAPKKSTYKSQIEKFLEHNNASGVQHLAFSTQDIVNAVRHFKKHYIEFLSIPDDYYDNLSDTLKKYFQNIFSSIKELGILVDQDNDGYLQQIFTKPIQTKPTFFLEIIQRSGANSFGKNNITALFKAVEKQLDNHQ